MRYCRGFVRGYCLNVYSCLFVLTEIRPSSSHNLGNVPRLFFFSIFLFEYSGGVWILFVGITKWVVSFCLFDILLHSVPPVLVERL